jgi:hypothetical protein
MPDIRPTQVPALVGGLERLTGEISGLRTDVQALVQGLTLMAEGQETQTLLLQEILIASTQDPPGENPMAGLIQTFTQTLAGLEAAVHTLSRSNEGLTQRLATAIIRGAAPLTTIGQPASSEA